MEPTDLRHRHPNLWLTVLVSALVHVLYGITLVFLDPTIVGAYDAATWALPLPVWGAFSVTIGLGMLIGIRYNLRAMRAFSALGQLMAVTWALNFFLVMVLTGAPVAGAAFLWTFFAFAHFAFATEPVP